MIKLLLTIMLLEGRTYICENVRTTTYKMVGLYIYMVHWIWTTVVLAYAVDLWMDFSLHKIQLL